MKDVLFHNLFGIKGRKTTSVVPPSWNPAPNKLRSKNIPTQNNIRGTALRFSDTQPLGAISEPEVEGGTNPDYSGGACDEGNLNNIALRKS
jgi:hypothetical protein